MEVTPMRDLMVVEAEPRKETSAGGILLPNAALETNTLTGKVLSVGPGAIDEKTGKLVEVDVKVGDTVLFHSNAGIKVSGEKEEILKFLLREEDILAMVD